MTEEAYTQLCIQQKKTFTLGSHHLVEDNSTLQDRGLQFNLGKHHDSSHSLYGVDILPIYLETIKGLEAIQKQVGKVLLEVPKSMANEVVELEL